MALLAIFFDNPACWLVLIVAVIACVALYSKTVGATDANVEQQSSTITEALPPRSLPDRLRQLEQLHIDGLLTDGEYQERRQKLLDSL